jgi:hypothetical protein
MKLEVTPAGFMVCVDGRPILSHSAISPCVFVGRGNDRIAMHRGRFEIEDRLVERCPLDHAEIDGERIMLSPGKGQAPRLMLWPEGDAIVLRAVDLSIRMSTFGAAASSFPFSTCAAGGFRCGAPSPALGVTRRLRSHSGRTPPTRRAATITTPIIRSRPMFPRPAMRFTSQHQPFVLLISATLRFTRSRFGRFRSVSSCLRHDRSSNWSRCCRAASGASRRCRSGSTTARSSD